MIYCRSFFSTAETVIFSFVLRTWLMSFFCFLPLFLQFLFFRPATPQFELMLPSAGQKFELTFFFFLLTNLKSSKHRKYLSVLQSGCKMLLNGREVVCLFVCLFFQVNEFSVAVTQESDVIVREMTRNLLLMLIRHFICYFLPI